MLKVLLADKSAAFSKQAAEELAVFFEVKICKNGKEVLEEYLAFCPDIIVMELELPELDGISVLRTLRGAGHRVPVLAMSTTLSSTYVQQNLIRLGVEFLLPKPCTVTAVVSRLQEMAGILTDRDWTVDDKVTSLLLHMGFSAKGLAFRYTHHALCMLVTDRDLLLTKVVYMEIAKRHGTTKGAVERAIRCSIERAWKGRSEQVWRCFFAPGCNGMVEKPSNAAFLHRMVIALENKKIV